MGKNSALDPETASVEVIMPEGFGSSFSDKAVRAAFIRKVYSILLSQLTITTAFIAVFCFTPPIKNFYCAGYRTDADGNERCVAITENGLIIYIVSYVVFFVTYLTIACCQSVRRTFPGNLIAMAIFTLSLSLWVSSIAIYHDANWVLMAIGITALLCLGLTLFSFQTKWDFTGMGIYLFAGSWILFLFGITAVIFFAKSWPILHTVYSALMAILFSFFLIYDTQQLIGGKKYAISPEEHIFAAIQLYIDVVYIFLAILNLGKR